MKRRVESRAAWLCAIAFFISLVCAGQAVAQAWTQLAPTGGPPVARNNHAAAFNPASNRMIVFGGYTSLFVNDTWVLSNADGSSGTPVWTQLSPASSPSVRDGMAYAYNATSNRMIVFGGYSFGPFNDVWVLSNADNSSGTPTWTQLSPTGGPPGARYRAAGAYDATNNVLIVTDGWSGCCYSDAWILSHADGTGGTPTWTQLSPTGTAPSPRFGHATVYDPATNELILFGGYDGNYYNDTWVLSHANGTGGTPAWTQLSPAGTPPPVRGYHTTVYDAATNRMVVFAGANSSSLLNDVWVLDHANGTGGTPTWSQLSPTGTAPTPRYVHTAVYNPANNRMVVFDGGGVGGNIDETWVLTNASGVTAIPVGIAIRPNRAGNAISLSTTVTVPVAILSSATFDATTQVDRTSLTFGHSGSEHSLASCQNRYLDVNGDGRLDLTCNFTVSQTGFQIGDTTGYLQGMTTVGNPFAGSDTVSIRN